MVKLQQLSIARPAEPIVASDCQVVLEHFVLYAMSRLFSNEVAIRVREDEQNRHEENNLLYSGVYNTRTVYAGNQHCVRVLPVW